MNPYPKVIPASVNLEKTENDNKAVTLCNELHPHKFSFETDQESERIPNSF